MGRPDGDNGRSVVGHRAWWRLWRLLGSALIFWMLASTLVACGVAEHGPCLDGGHRCAAAETPSGMRSLRRGYRLGRYHWLRRANRESGVPDVGIQAEWLPTQERR